MPDLTPPSPVLLTTPADGAPPNRPSRTTPVTSRRTALAGFATLAATAAGGTSAAAASPRGTAAPAVVRRAAQRLVRDDGFPSV